MDAIFEISQRKSGEYETAEIAAHFVGGRYVSVTATLTDAVLEINKRILLDDLKNVRIDINTETLPME